MSAVMFGSPEAKAIAEEDRRLDREAEAMLRAYGETGDAGIDELRRERKESKTRSPTWKKSCPKSTLP